MEQKERSCENCNRKESCYSEPLCSVGNRKFPYWEPKEEPEVKEKVCSTCHENTEANTCCESFKSCVNRSHWKPKKEPKEGWRERYLANYELQECGWKCRGCDGSDARKCKFRQRDEEILAFIQKEIESAYQKGLRGEKI